MGRSISRILFTQTTRTGSFAVVCLINMLLNFRWSIPAWLLLAAHFLFGFPPLWAFFIALALWPLTAIVMTAIMRLLRRLAYMSGGYSGGGGKVVHVDENTPNRNPYSATREKEENVKAGYSSAFQIEGKDWNAEDTQSGETPPTAYPTQPVSYPEAEGKDWYAEYRQSEEYKKEQSNEPGRKSELE
ncbi:MAG: hypothetical protein IJM51_00850 [Clostridia bacterium]|nr:hypothetical protein [Clostridia bacterium]